MLPVWLPGTLHQVCGGAGGRRGGLWLQGWVGVFLNSPARNLENSESESGLRSHCDVVFVQVGGQNGFYLTSGDCAV